MRAIQNSGRRILRAPACGCLTNCSPGLMELDLELLFAKARVCTFQPCFLTFSRRWEDLFDVRIQMGEGHSNSILDTK